MSLRLDSNQSNAKVKKKVLRCQEKELLLELHCRCLKKILSNNKQLVLFSLLLISIILSSNFIGNPASVILFEYTNAQT
ncbi:MAG TPA: hypothetical protein VFY41_05625, partial [Nitrososphaeraceae archaeon]|nr:hypothetical protein [Nitrososphaeraceae archaeon]